MASQDYLIAIALIEQNDIRAMPLGGKEIKDKLEDEGDLIKLSEEVLKFKTFLTKDQEQTLKNNSINCEVIDISEIKNISDQIIGLYPTVGENLDYLNSNNLKLNFLYRKLDQNSWQYCNKGFFNFKNYIPKIISIFN